MNTIYNFLIPAWKELQNESRNNIVLIPLISLLLSFPTTMAINNICLGLFLLSVLFSIKKINFHTFLLLPICLYLWICFSYFWSYEPDNTLKSLSRELVLFLVPISFFYIPKFTKNQRNVLFKYYSYGMFVFAVYFLIRALIRFFITQNTDVFFYHGPQNYIDTGLVPRLLNAIHVSVYMVIAFFYFFLKDCKKIGDKLILSILFFFIFLLSSKNVIVVFVLLILLQLIFYSKISNRLRLRNLIILIFIFGAVLSFSKIKERFFIEFTSNTEKSLSHNVEVNHVKGVNNISIYEAWNNNKFTYNDFLPGTAFRVYQVRVFKELIEEYPIFWNGFGLDASQSKILLKEKEHNLYPGYGNYNFHNQYIQIFAELGFIGLILFLFMLIFMTKKAFSSKDFLHIVFSILMISVFLTESFLWRQRGVCFFITFYCFFNVMNFTKKEI